MEELKKSFQEQADRLIYYAPYNFLRELGTANHLNFLRNLLNPWLEEKNGYFTYKVELNGNPFYFLFRNLPWDSDYFQIPTYKLFLALYPTSDFEALCKAIACFKDYLHSKHQGYFFGEIPSEDSLLLQAFTNAGFRLTETRLTYFYDKVSEFANERYLVRAASLNDILLLRKTASENRNTYDRYHADIFFTNKQADNYLATYAEACIQGLADIVLVPGQKESNSEAFMAISRLNEDAEKLNTSFARILLTAVSPNCKGWHLKLASETIQQAKEWKSHYVLMTTQATNRAVFRTSEKLGFKLGSTTHLLSITI